VLSLLTLALDSRRLDRPAGQRRADFSLLTRPTRVQLLLWKFPGSEAAQLGCRDVMTHMCLKWTKITYTMSLNTSLN